MLLNLRFLRSSAGRRQLPGCCRDVRISC